VVKMALGKRFAALLVLGTVTASVSGCGYNTIPTQEEAAKASWAEVQNQYQRRADLVPNLVATVQGAAKQEKEVLTAVTEARAGISQARFDATTPTDPAKFAEYQAAQDRLGASLRPLIAMQEQYPQLKSLEGFAALQGQLEGTENRITIARRDYNASVQTFNTTLKTFPSVIWAKTAFGSTKAMQLFQATAGSEKPPEVKF
jgi:LemA protein